MADLIPLIQARNCGPDRSGQKIDLLVIHTAETPERVGAARSVANYFAGPNAPQASAHYSLDDAETILCVPEHVVAWAAPGANRNGIHIEHAGFAAQNDAQWGDDYSQAVLMRSAKLAADICLRHQIPIRRVTAAELKAGGARGICGHVDVTNGLNGGSGHTDPGQAFPFEAYLTAIRAALPQPEDVGLDEETRQRVMALVALSLRADFDSDGSPEDAEPAA